MGLLRQFIGRLLDVEISGNNKHTGVLVDFGQDILVIYNGFHFLYIPFVHVQNFRISPQSDDETCSPPEKPIENDNEITYRTILNHAKGLFVEIYVTDKISVHGYVIKVLTNYFVFYSPVYKTMLIPLFHLKWLIPYNSHQIPYSLDKKLLPVNPVNISLVRTFEEQLKRLEGKIVVFDMGMNANKIGLLQKVENPTVELVTAEGEKLYWNIHHIKTAHSPCI